MMPLWASSQTTFPTPPDHCYPSNPFLTFISSHLHTCIPTSLALLSIVSGILSIVSWVFAQLPQIFKNYRLKSTAGISIYFLLEWFLGDGTNLAGAVLTRQASWQLVLAGYYVFVDTILIVQWFWYTNLNSRGEEWSQDTIDIEERASGMEQIQARDSSTHQNRKPGDSKADKGASTAKQNRDIGSTPRNIFRRPNYTSSPPSKESFTPSSSRSTQPPKVSRVQSSPMPGPSPKTFLFMACLVALVSAQDTQRNEDNPAARGTSSGSRAELAGKYVSWASAFLYLGSRLPQLYKNYRRRSTSGLSPALFFAAFCGNLFYSASLLANPCAWYDFGSYGGGGWAGEEGSSRLDWSSRAAPFFLGAAGVLGLDGAVGLQFLMYGEGEKGDQIVKVRDERGRSRWRRVSGWMRGWVPSVSPSKTANAASGEQDTLVNSRRGSGYGTV